jgi:hypothetical protein
MDGLFDQTGAPTFTSSFVAARRGILLGEENGVVHLRIPGTLTQSNKIGKTTYRAALEVHAVRGLRFQRLEQIACIGASTACQ